MIIEKCEKIPGDVDLCIKILWLTKNYGYKILWILKATQIKKSLNYRNDFYQNFGWKNILCNEFSKILIFKNPKFF